MAVLIAPRAGDGLRTADDATARAHRVVYRLLFAPLPADVRDEEITVAALFRASLILNFLTGGAPEMTFSARCHRSGRISRGILTRTMWRGTAMGIDAACAILRGEDAHCATAWANHRVRGVSVRRA